MHDDLIPFLQRAFAEDIGDGDHTTLSCIPAGAMGKSRLIIKEAGVVAGVEVAKEVFHYFDPELKVTVFIQDGSDVKPGDIVFEVEGRVHSLLQTERLMLNIMPSTTHSACAVNRQPCSALPTGSWRPVSTTFTKH